MTATKEETVIVCVLGMHRSGTSLVAGLLTRVGVYWGPQEHMMKADTSNPKGYWEYQPIVDINDRILRRLGGSWRSLPRFPAGWEKQKEFDDLRQQASRVLREGFAHAKLWGWKDPRTCLTLPFWQSMLPETNYLICLRSPVDVAQSLSRRDGITLEEGAYLWLAYLRRTVEYTADRSARLVFYEDVLHDWRSTLTQICDFLGTPGRAEQYEVQHSVSTFVDRNLQHHRSPAGAVHDTDVNLDPDSVLSVARSIYASMRNFEPCDTSTMLSILDEAIDTTFRVVDCQRRARHEHYERMTRLLRADVARVIPEGDSFILVDQNELATKATVGRHALPFLNCHGEYWGPPADSFTAIQEMERLREAGAGFIAFGFPAFWWLDYYAEFRDYLSSHYRRVLANERIVAFDLRRTL